MLSPDTQNGAHLESQTQYGGDLAPVVIRSKSKIDVSLRFSTERNKDPLGLTAVVLISLCSMAAALKQLFGVQGFFEEKSTYLAEGHGDYVFGALAAFVAAIFYFRNTRDAKNYLRREIVNPVFSLCFPRSECFQDDLAQAATVNYGDSLNQYLLALIAFDPGLNRVSALGRIIQNAVSILFATAFAAAQLQILLQATPKALNLEGVKELLAASSLFTNLSVGVVNANAVSEDLGKALNRFLNNYSPFRVELEIISQGLRSYEAMLAKVAEPAERQDYRDALKEGLSTADTFLDVMAQVFKHAAIVQEVINDENRDECKKFDMPDFRIVLPPTTYLGKFFDMTAFISFAMIALAAVVINFQGAASLVQGCSLPLALMVGAAASYAPFGLNKRSTDQWKVSMESLYHDLLTVQPISDNALCRLASDIHLTVQDRTSADWVGLVLGFGLASLQAIAQLWLTKSGLEKVEFMKSWDADIREAVIWFCMLSGFALVAVTKAEPSKDLLSQLAAKIRSCFCRKDVSQKTNYRDSELLELYDQFLKMIGHAVVECSSKNGDRQKLKSSLNGLSVSKSADGELTAADSLTVRKSLYATLMSKWTEAKQDHATRGKTQRREDEAAPLLGVV